ncbi:hypothetical protein BHM03_00013760 [Ensete ventricosum]|nr:hypothetical protein BHM03_00013760 [Ensete ventricosum]
MTDDVSIDADVVVDPFVALHLHRHTIVVESKSAAKPIMEIHRLSKLDLEIHAPLADAGDMPLLAAHLLNHHHHHLFIAEGQKNTIVALLNLSIFAHKRSCASQVSSTPSASSPPSSPSTERVRENAMIVLLNLVKSNRDKTVGDVKEVDGPKATVRTLASSNSRVSTRGRARQRCY